MSQHRGSVSRLPIISVVLAVPLVGALSQGPARPGASETPAPPKQPLEAQGPATPAASGTPAPSPQCNVPVCRRFYRSFRVSVILLSE
jgi:hypothetical protein